MDLDKACAPILRALEKIDFELFCLDIVEIFVMEVMDITFYGIARCWYINSCTTHRFVFSFSLEALKLEVFFKRLPCIGLLCVLRVSL